MIKLNKFYVVALVMITNLVFVANVKALSEHRYTKNFTFNDGRVFIVDPYVWAYTEEFSTRFSMPEKWIDKGLKGLVAVAFRMTAFDALRCGYGKQEDSCWNQQDCQVDIYFKDEVDLPWVRDDIKSDNLRRGIVSSDYLDIKNPVGIKRYPKESGAPYGVLVSGGMIEAGGYKGGNASVKSFNREFDGDLQVISYVGMGVCPRVVAQGRMAFYDKEAASKLSKAIVRKEDVDPVHVFEFSEEFMKRANSSYKEKNKKNIDVTDRLMKQFKKSIKK